MIAYKLLVPISRRRFRPAVMGRDYPDVYHRGIVNKRIEDWGPFACFKNIEFANIARSKDKSYYLAKLYKVKIKKSNDPKMFGIRADGIKYEMFWTPPEGTILADEFEIVRKVRND